MSANTTFKAIFNHLLQHKGGIIQEKQGLPILMRGYELEPPTIGKFDATSLAL
jgi:hypothetical protein